MKRAGLAAALTLGLAPAHGHAESPWLGVFLGVPGDGSGAPVMNRHLPLGATARFPISLSPLELTTAITAGLGIPIAGVGASAWGGLDLRLPIAPRIALTTTPGIRTGFVGPGYYARHSDVFVGYDYIHAGPWTIAPRLPVGVAVRVTRRAELFAELVVEAPVIPSPELLLGGAFGARARL